MGEYVGLCGGNTKSVTVECEANVDLYGEEVLEV